MFPHCAALSQMLITTVAYILFDQSYLKYHEVHNNLHICISFSTDGRKFWHPRLPKLLSNPCVFCIHPNLRGVSCPEMVPPLLSSHKLCDLNWPQSLTERTEWPVVRQVLIDYILVYITAWWNESSRVGGMLQGSWCKGRVGGLLSVFMMLSPKG